MYAGRTRLRAFFRGKKSTFEIYGRFKRIYADPSESLPLGQIFPYRDELWIRDESMLSFGFFLSRSREILLSFPIFICSLSCDFYGPDKWTSVSANFFLFERNIRDRLDFDVSSLINNSTTLINLQFFFY